MKYKTLYGSSNVPVLRCSRLYIFLLIFYPIPFSVSCGGKTDRERERERERWEEDRVTSYKVLYSSYNSSHQLL